MTRISHKLKNPIEGALAGGGDAATSPLYVFGPFLSLIYTSALARYVFGGSVWLAVLTIAVVSAMYRLVMRWVTDGSGGSGLSEEEFGGWAVKINSAITFVEYTLTFLVSMSAMVTFIADRLPVLNNEIMGIQYRTFFAIALSIFTGWLVNRGPKIASRTFGVATAGILILLWVMVFAAAIRNGIHLPILSLTAFTPPNLGLTINGYVHILAVMTGIEVFANLVPAFQGNEQQKSRKSFQSLLIIMCTTVAAMLFIGPAIFSMADPSLSEVSVFTQTMDQLLPAPLPYIGSFLGVFVLMSASAASSQGLQNLALGLKERHYLPPNFASLNPYDIANKPVWLQVGVVSLCFLFFGTHEATYLALYAAGVFILLSMTGWAVTKRLLRRNAKKAVAGQIGLIAGTAIAALLTTASTFIIFIDRFLEGAWLYFVFIPILYMVFSFFRKSIGVPSNEMEYLGRIDSNLLAGFGFGQASVTSEEEGNGENEIKNISWSPERLVETTGYENKIEIQRAMVLLDGSEYAAQALPVARFICEGLGSSLTLFSASKDLDDIDKEKAVRKYLTAERNSFKTTGIQTNLSICAESPAKATHDVVINNGIGLVILTTRGGSGNKNWKEGGLSNKLVHLLDTPIFLVQVYPSGPPLAPHIKRILVTLDGSSFSEQILPYVLLLAKQFNSEVMLVCVPVVPEGEKYRAPYGVIQRIRKQTVANMKKYLEGVAETLRKEQVVVRTIVTGSNPARDVVEVGKREGVDLIMMTSQGRGGLNLMLMGSVAQEVVQFTDSPVFILPINHELVP